jgi:hypothetical protein
MLASEIISAVSSYLGEDISEEDAVVAINESIGALGEMVCIYDDGTITPIAPWGWMALPANAVSVMEVRNSRGKWYSFYKVSGNEICFKDIDTYSVRYRRTATRLTSLSDRLELHEVYRTPIETFVKAWWKLRESDGTDQDGLRLYNLFQQQAATAFSQLSSASTGPRRMTVQR